MMILEAKEDQSDGAQSGGGIPRMLRSVKGRPALTPSDASSGEDSSSSEESSSSEDHIWELPVSHYHEIMVIYPYTFFGAISQLFSCIICINDCICII